MTSETSFHDIFAKMAYDVATFRTSWDFGMEFGLALLIVEQRSLLTCLPVSGLKEELRKRESEGLLLVLRR